jgi:hypothetical protein
VETIVFISKMENISRTYHGGTASVVFYFCK